MITRKIVDLFFNFMIFFVIFIIVLEIILFLLLRGKDNKFKGKKISLLGLLFEIDDLTILSLSVLVIRYVFVVFSIFYDDSISNIHFLILLLLSLIFAVTSKSVKNFILELISSLALYFGLICSKLLAGYIVDVRFEWYISLGNICLIFFLIMYITFFLFRNVNYVVSKSKYVRRERNVED